jgi:hypothetical protein
MSNRATLDQLLDLPVTELVKLPINQIGMLYEDVAEAKARVKRADERLFSVMDARFGVSAASKRKAKGSNTGTVRVAENDYVIIADLPKKVLWDEAGLVAVEKSLVEMGEPTEDYIKTSRTVSEAAYNNWPTSLKVMFEPHRTVSAGKATYKIERSKRAQEAA